MQGEFFFDKKTSNLYLVHNGTGAPPADATFVVPQKQILVNMSGSQWDPVTDVKLVGITYTASASTYMEPHGVPSAGDWALDRYGAIYLQVRAVSQLTTFPKSFFSHYIRSTPPGHGECHGFRLHARASRRQRSHGKRLQPQRHLEAQRHLVRRWKRVRCLGLHERNRH
jgi:hypothetical protein